MIHRKPSLLWAWSPLILLALGLAFFCVGVIAMRRSEILGGALCGIAGVLWLKSFGRIRRP